MPPDTFTTRWKPRSTRKFATLMERTPWWHRTTVSASRSRSWSSLPSHSWILQRPHPHFVAQVTQLQPTLESCSAPSALCGSSNCNYHPPLDPATPNSGFVAVNRIKTTPTLRSCNVLFTLCGLNNALRLQPPLNPATPHSCFVV